MGLLSYIDTMEQKGPGLLARAEQYESAGVKTGNFYDWCKKNAFSHIALLQRNGDAYHITKSIGLDAESIALSYSSKDFWDGTLITNGDWNSYSQGTAESAAFNQFFSEEMLSIVAKLHFIKMDDSILMIIQEQDEEETNLPPSDSVKSEISHFLYMPENKARGDELEAAVKRGLTMSNANLYFLSVKNAVASAIKDVPFAENSARQKMTDIIYDHIARICKTIFQTPNCSELGKDGEIKIVFFAKDEVDEQLLQFHIVQTLTDMVGKEAAKGIVLLMAGVCPNVKGTLTFLQQG